MCLLPLDSIDKALVAAMDRLELDLELVILLAKLLISLFGSSHEVYSYIAPSQNFNVLVLQEIKNYTRPMPPLSNLILSNILSTHWSRE